MEYLFGSKERIISLSSIDGGLKLQLNLSKSNGKIQASIPGFSLLSAKQSEVEKVLDINGRCAKKTELSSNENVDSVLAALYRQAKSGFETADCGFSPSASGGRRILVVVLETKLSVGNWGTCSQFGLRFSEEPPSEIRSQMLLLANTLNQKIDVLLEY